MTIRVHGITNCDSVKKARKWLEIAGKDYEFVDFRKAAPSESEISKWVNSAGIAKVLNKRGTTWRNLSDAQKAVTDETELVKLMAEQPTLIKRPVIETDKGLIVGYSADEMEAQC